jgi:hypothetical protein
MEMIAQVAVGLPQHRPAAGGQHAMGLRRQLGEHGLFESRKAASPSRSK